jgi:hypothetical protein
VVVEEVEGAVVVDKFSSNFETAGVWKPVLLGVVSMLPLEVRLMCDMWLAVEWFRVWPWE